MLMAGLKDSSLTLTGAHILYSIPFCLYTSGDRLPVHWWITDFLPVEFTLRHNLPPHSFLPGEPAVGLHRLSLQPLPQLPSPTFSSSPQES